MPLLVSEYALLPGSRVPSAQHTVLRACPQLAVHQAPLTQVLRDMAQVRLDHSRMQGQVMAQQLEVPGVVFKVRLTRGRQRRRGSPWDFTGIQVGLRCSEFEG